jgi:hypothetical protein
MSSFSSSKTGARALSANKASLVKENSRIIHPVQASTASAIADRHAKVWQWQPVYTSQRQRAIEFRRRLPALVTIH